MLLMAGHHARAAPSVKAARFVRVHRRETESLYRCAAESQHTHANP
jgi:hypothetical protein